MRQLLIVWKIREIIGILICTLVTDSLVSCFNLQVFVTIFILELLSFQQSNNNHKIKKGNSSKSSNLKYYRKAKTSKATWHTDMANKSSEILSQSPTWKDPINLT